MSFTQDELQSFNTILEQKLSQQRRELERGFDQRMSLLRREFEQRLTQAQQENARSLARRLTDQQNRLKELVNRRFEEQQAGIAMILDQRSEQLQEQQKQLGNLLERSLAAQLTSIEHLISQHVVEWSTEHTSVVEDGLQSEQEAAEWQTEIPWEDLVGVIDKAMNERLGVLNESIQATMKNMELYLATQVHTLHDNLVLPRPTSLSGVNGTQDIYTTLEQLERIIESMQVAMAANHALLSNRLYQHQHLPPERAHQSSEPTTVSQEAHLNGTSNNQLSQPREQGD